MQRALQILLLLFFLFSSLDSQSFEKPQSVPNNSFQKSSQTKNNAILNINNFTYWLTAYGQGAQPPNQAYEGSQFPRGTTHPIFADGFIWGGKCYLDAAHTLPAPVQTLRVGGSSYNIGNATGWIDGTGANARAISTSDPRARIYRIRRDYVTMPKDELMRDAMENNLLTSLSSVSKGDMDVVSSQYAEDWNNWPVEHGAPYIERNGTPGYQKPPQFGEFFTLDSLLTGNYDEPGVAGADPNLPADQVIWTVFNDLLRGNMIGFAGSEPMGIEGQLTIWGYKAGGAFENLFFKRLRLINKGGAVVNSGTGAKGSLYLDSLYVGQWSDEDLGDAANDLVGCDSLQGLAFVYNGVDKDAEYSNFLLPPPSAGYDLLSGALVNASPTDSGVFDFRRVTGKRNMPMTSFAFLAAGFLQCSDCDVPFSYGSALRWWKMLRGFRTVRIMDPDILYPTPPGDPPTYFPLSGDPVKGVGFIDGLGTNFSPIPGDRRTLSSTGPFTFAPGDTQEIYMAVVGGLGADRLSSVAIMKANDDAAQAAFDGLFTIPHSPAQPLFAATELNGSILLAWNTGSGVELVESVLQQPGNYAFEGYNVYQLSSQDLRTARKIKIATFDVVNDVEAITESHFSLETGLFLPVVVQTGKNSGVRRSLYLKTDALKGGSIRNGTEYYFAVTAYNYSRDLIALSSFETAIKPIRVVPRIPFGIGGMAQYGDTVSVSHSEGQGSGQILATVVNPVASTGATYELRFDTSGGTTSWSLRNITQNHAVVTNQPLYVGSDDPPAVEGGINLLVAGPNGPDDVYSFSLAAIQSGPEVQKESSRRVNVFPNPYYADQVQRGTSVRSLVTFNNLPQRATIRIFNLAGHLVRTLRKDDASQFVDWDLTNEDNWQVGSGIYLCYIEMPDIGEKKVLKLAVIQGQTYPGVY